MVTVGDKQWVTIRRGATAARRWENCSPSTSPERSTTRARVRETVVVAETREIVQTRYGLALGGQEAASGDKSFLEEDQGDELLQRITHDS